MKLVHILALVIPLVDCHLVRREIDQNGSAINAIADHNKDDTVYTILGDGTVPVPNLNVKPSLKGSVNSTANDEVTFITSTATPYLDLKPIPNRNELKTTTQDDNATEGFDANQVYHVTMATMDPESQTIMEGNLAQFNCSVITNYENVNIRWYRKNQDMMNSMYQNGQYEYIRYGFETGQEPVDKSTGMRTFWNVLTFFEVSLSDFGKYTCYVPEADLEQDAELTVEVRPLSMTKNCLSNNDCSWRSNYKCVNFRCQPKLSTSTTSIFSQPSSEDTSYSYATSLRFTVAAFLSGGLVITIVMFVILFREVCYKICERPNTSRRNRGRAHQFVYVIGRNNNSGTSTNVVTASNPTDKPPNYDACVSSSTAAHKDETPPPTYREQKKRDIPPPPPYDAFVTSPPEAEGGACGTTCSQIEDGATSQSDVPQTAAETTIPKELSK